MWKFSTRRLNLGVGGFEAAKSEVYKIKKKSKFCLGGGGEQTSGEYVGVI